MDHKVAPLRGRRPFPLLWLGMAMILWFSAAGADLFTGLEILADSLRAWETQAPAPDTAAAALPLEALFPGAAITPVGQALRIHLPPLHGEQFDATLWAHGPGPRWTFSVDMERRDSLVVLDGRVVDGLPADTALAALHRHVRSTLIALRTLAVPYGPAAPVGEGAPAPVRVKLVGARIDTFQYEPAVWWRCARELARGMRVYAFLLEAQVDADETALSWALFLRAPDGRSQHLMEWRERVATGHPAVVREYGVRLVPGVRLDNLDERVAPPAEERPPSSRWPLRLRRR